MNQLARKTATGAIINISVTMTKNIGQFLIVFPVLARILTPEQFGLVAMAMTLVGLLTMFNDLGISAALVRDENPSAAFWSSAFWLNLAFGLTMAGFAYGVAPYIAAFFAEPLVADFIRALSVVLFLHCLMLVPMAWLQRNFKFQTIAIIDLAAIFLSSVTAIAMALHGFGAWSLVWQQIVLHSVKTSACLFAHKAPIRLAFDWPKIKSVLPFSLGLTGTAFVAFLNRNTDNLLIGKFLGADSLGFYSRAYQLMMMPIMTISTGLSFAIYPAMSAVQSDGQKLGRAYLKAIAILSAIIFPAMTGIALVASPFVDLLFGGQWGPVVPILEILAFVGLMQSVGGVSNDVWKARGRSGVLLKWALIRAVGFAIAFSIGIYFGSLTAMATAYLIANVFFLVPFQLEVLKELGLSVRALLSTLAPQFWSTVAMAGMLLGVKVAFPGLLTLASPIELGLLASIGGITYLLTMLIFFRDFVDETVAEIQELRRGTGSTSEPVA